MQKQPYVFKMVSFAYGKFYHPTILFYVHESDSQIFMFYFLHPNTFCLLLSNLRSNVSDHYFEWKQTKDWQLLGQNRIIESNPYPEDLKLPRVQKRFLMESYNNINRMRLFFYRNQFLSLVLTIMSF